MFCNIAVDEKNMHEVDFTKIPDDQIKRFEVWYEWKDITDEATARLAQDLALLEQSSTRMMAKMTEALQVMYEGSLGAVQGVAQALEAHQLKIQEGHAQALDALKPIQKSQAEHIAQLHSVERRFRQMFLRIDYG